MLLRIFKANPCTPSISVSRKTVRKRIADGTIASYRLTPGRQVRIAPRDLEDYLQPGDRAPGVELELVG